MISQLPNGWSLTTLGRIARQDEYGLVDGPFGSNLPASEYTSHGIPVIRGSNLSLGACRFKEDEFVFVSRETANRLARSLCRPDDIIFTKKGTLGQTGLVPRSGRYSEYLLSSNQMKLSVDNTIAHPSFVFYYVSSDASQAKIVRDAEATGVPKTNLAYIKTFPIVLPPLPEQRAIARILGALDDKIELNRKMNATLEAMARAVFQSWFVDFDPVRAKAEGRAPHGMDAATAALFPDGFEDVDGRAVPRGWTVRGLDEIATYLNGLALQKYPPEGNESLPVIKIAQLRKDSSEGADRASANISKPYIVDDGDVLFSWSGSLEVSLWCGGRGALNQHLFKVTSDEYPRWFYFLWTLHHLPDFQHTAAGKATTMGHIQRHHLSDAKACVPPPELLIEMSTTLTPTIDRIITNKIEMRTLAELRDTLLPKLLSGELRVPEAMRMVEDAV